MVGFVGDDVGLLDYEKVFQKDLFSRAAEWRRERIMTGLCDESLITESEVEYIKGGILGIVRYLYENGKARLIDLDYGVGKMVGSFMESFGSPDITMLTDFMKERGIVSEGSYPYRFRLSSKYERVLDLLFMRSVAL